MQIQIVEPVVIVDIHCGNDGTMFLTETGAVLACGSNRNNKLGLNNRQGFLMAMKNIFNKVPEKYFPILSLRQRKLFGFLNKLVSFPSFKFASFNVFYIDLHVVSFYSDLHVVVSFNLDLPPYHK